MRESNDLSAAMEDYIKTIYQLEAKNKVARVSDIGRRLNVKKASVVAAVNLLKKNELITHERYGFISLTEKGKEIAGKIVKKNQAIFEFLTIALKIDDEKAKGEACGMEHSMSDETAEKINQLARSYQQKASKKSDKKPVKR
jgi:DtxR family Mn-dependent transcriptional regulator